MTRSTAQPGGPFRFLVLALASNGGLGYAPFAPGTVGTLAGIPCFFLMARLPWPLAMLTLIALLVLSFWVSDLAGRIYAVADDGRIVIDELVGYLVTVALLPFSWQTALLGMLNSCASGVTVVNIDNGFGAAFAANRINKAGTRLKEQGCG